MYALFSVCSFGQLRAIRLASDHPTVFSREGRRCRDDVRAFCIAWGVTVLAYVLYRVELAGKRLDLIVRELREALA